MQEGKEEGQKKRKGIGRRDRDAEGSLCRKKHSQDGRPMGG